MRLDPWKTPTISADTSAIVSPEAAAGMVSTAKNGSVAVPVAPVRLRSRQTLVGTVIAAPELVSMLYPFTS